MWPLCGKSLAFPACNSHLSPGSTLTLHMRGDGGKWYFVVKEPNNFTQLKDKTFIMFSSLINNNKIVIIKPMRNYKEGKSTNSNFNGTLA